MKAIYKIENLINHKIYIGQSKTQKIDGKKHCEKYSDGRSLIKQAIQKYGKENFSFKIIGWFEDYNEKEKFYIKFFNSLAPNGYNILDGGQEPPVKKGEENGFAKISNETAFLIKQDLKNWDIPRKNIAKKYNVSKDLLRHMIEGTTWYDEKEIYPLRPSETYLDELKADKIIKDLILTNIPLNQLGPKYGWGRSSAKEINQGRNHHRDNLIYPIRNNKEKNKTILNL